MPEIVSAADDAAAQRSACAGAHSPVCAVPAAISAEPRRALTLLRSLGR